MMLEKQYRETLRKVLTKHKRFVDLIENKHTRGFPDMVVGSPLYGNSLVEIKVASPFKELKDTLPIKSLKPHQINFLSSGRPSCYMVVLIAPFTVVVKGRDVANWRNAPPSLREVWQGAVSVFCDMDLQHPRGEQFAKSFDNGYARMYFDPVSKDVFNRLNRGHKPSTITNSYGRIL